MPLQLEKVSKTISDKWILRDVSFDVSEGSVFGICGATGSGKSTLLNILANGAKTNGGSIKYNGVEITGSGAKNRDFHLLSNKELSRFSSIFGGSKRSRSSGERQLNAFSEMLATKPGVVLLDDPFTQLDLSLRLDVLDKLSEMARTNNCVVIFASSDFEQIASVAPESAILSNGEIIQIGDPREIYKTPETVAVANLTGDINLFGARRTSSTNADLPEFLTIDGGHRITASQTQISRLGAINQTVTLAIRPENISMSMGASFPEDNLIKAVVVGIKFLAATSLIEFDAGGIRLNAKVFKVVGLNIGDECMLGLPPGSIHVLKN